MLGFQSSSRLAAAYGIAVTGTMMITTLLFHRVARDLWGWPRLGAWSLTALFLVGGRGLLRREPGEDRATAAGSPSPSARGVFTLMSTWKRGRDALAMMLKDAGLPLELFMADMARGKVQRVPGTAVFMTSNPGGVPPVLLHHLKHNKVLHERVILVSILTEEIPAVPERERVSTRDLGSGFFQVLARYGFMESPDVPALLDSLPHRPLANAGRASPSCPCRPPTSWGARRCSPTARPRSGPGGSACSS